MKSVVSTSLLFAVALWFPLRLPAQHAHLNAGAVGTNQNDQLIWANGADFMTTSGYVKTLEYTNSGRYAGYYQGGITPTALPATAAHAGPDPAASALGSYLHFRLACLEGPAGGLFNFWESAGTTPAISLAPGDSSSSLWRLSESDGSSGSDPYGHIHGRRFTVTKPGLYKITFTAVDASVNGAGGGPIHTPSAPLPIWFQAGVNLLRVEPDEDHTHVHFPAGIGATWQVESADTLEPQAEWTAIGNPVLGDDYIHEVTDQRPVTSQRFYRVLSVTP